MPPERIPSIKEDRDSKGHLRSTREMTDGTMFYGSDEEFAEENEKRHEEAKS